MSGQGEEATQSSGTGTTTSGTDSGSGSGSLSDAFVVVTVGKSTTASSRRRVQAPAGSSNLEVRRSSRVALSRARSSRATTLEASGQVLGDAPAGGERTTGFAPQVLHPVVEEERSLPGQPHLPTGPLGTAVGFRDTATAQASPMVEGAVLVGRKRSATSAAPGSVRRGHGPNKLASAADFSPGHFNEPTSDDHIPDLLHPSAAPASPMRVDPVIPPHARQLATPVTPISSPLSQNPLLLRPTVGNRHTPSPRRQPLTTTLHTRDGNVAWAALEGLHPIPEGFQAAGYAPVGGITYRVRSPRFQVQGSHGSQQGRKLFEEYASMADLGSHDHTQHNTQTGTQLATHSNLQGVRYNSRLFFLMHPLTRI